MGTWTNDDGLYLRFGQTEADVTKAGEPRDGDGMERVAEVEIAAADLTVSTTKVYDGLTIPNGAHITKAEFYVETAFAGATGTLTIGLVDQDRSTAIDADGIDAAIAVTAIDAAGDLITCDGALINTTLSNTGLVSALNGTAQFTAGVGQLRIYYHM